MPQNTPLRLLMGAYLNQDWPEEYGTAEAAIDDFVLRDPDSARGLSADIQELLATTRSEAELETALDRLGCSYTADWDGGTYRAWLEQVERRVADALAHPPAGS